MSKFFKALEQAEREHALRERAQQQGAIPLEPQRVEAGPPQEDLSPPRDASAPATPGALAPGTPSAPPALGVPSRHEEPGTVAQGDEPLDRVDGHLVSLLNPAALEAEQYRALRHLIEQLSKTADLSVVAVSSPATGDGKTTTVINLAGALAQSPEARVLLIDADLRRSSVADQLGLGDRGSPGLVDVVLDPTLGLDDVVRPCEPFNFSVVTAGRHSSAHYELLKSPRLGDLLQEARGRYHHILLDTPPLVAFPDCRVIGRWVDGFLVVVSAHRTPRKLVEEALNVVDSAKLVGLVFNGDDRPLFGYYGYAYGQSGNGDRPGWWGRAIRKLYGSRPHRGRHRRA